MKTVQKPSNSVQWLKLFLYNGPNRIVVSIPHLMTKTVKVCKTPCSLEFFRVPDHGGGGGEDRQISNSKCYTSL
jgi:hypothetical protein